MERAFGSIIYDLRKEANLTQAALAERAGLTQSAISRLEDGSRWPRPRTLQRIFKVLNVPPFEAFHQAATVLEQPDVQRWSEYDKEDD